MAVTVQNWFRRDAHQASLPEAALDIRSWRPLTDHGLDREREQLAGIRLERVDKVISDARHGDRRCPWSRQLVEQQSRGDIYGRLRGRVQAVVDVHLAQIRRVKAVGHVKAKDNDLLVSDEIGAILQQPLQGARSIATRIARVHDREDQPVGGPKGLIHFFRRGQRQCRRSLGRHTQVRGQVGHGK